MYICIFIHYVYKCKYTAVEAIFFLYFFFRYNFCFLETWYLTNLEWNLPSTLVAPN